MSQKVPLHVLNAMAPDCNRDVSIETFHYVTTPSYGKWLVFKMQLICAYLLQDLIPAKLYTCNLIEG
jgi:hypothetical protein